MAAFLAMTSTPAVRAAQERDGSRAGYARFDDDLAFDGLTARETDFIAARDSFYMASVSETGWPYIQHRGGPAGFLKVLGPKTVAFADFRGNRQYITLGNIAGENRVNLFLMDYTRRARLKIFGRARVVDLGTDPDLAQALILPDYKAVPEQAFVIDVAGFDWNCPQHITPRFSIEEVTTAVQPLRDRIAQLEAKLAQYEQGDR